MSNPGFYFYTGDYFKDTRVLTPEARGCYMDWLILLHEHGGSITLPVAAFGQYCGVSEETARHVLNQLEATGVADVFWQNPNKTITKLNNRRMIRAEQHREHVREVRSAAGKKGMAKRYQNYQPSSSSSTSLNHIKNHKNDSLPLQRKASIVWPEESLWLKTFLETEAAKLVPTPNGALLDYTWWNAVSETCGGLTQSWLTTEFSRISAWLKENPARSPSTSNGWKRFIRHWLEKAHEMERRRLAYENPRGIRNQNRR